MYLRTLAGDGKSGGPEYTPTTNTLNNLGSFYFHQRKLEEAEAIYLRALAGYETDWGLCYMNTLTTRYNLALLLKKKRRAPKCGKALSTRGSRLYHTIWTRTTENG